MCHGDSSDGVGWNGSGFFFSSSLHPLAKSIPGKIVREEEMRRNLVLILFFFFFNGL